MLKTTSTPENVKGNEACCDIKESRDLCRSPVITSDNDMMEAKMTG